MVLTYDYDGSGIEREFLFSAYTLMVYEQEFKKGLIEDVYGRIAVPNKNAGETLIADYTIDNWQAYVRALWAGLKAASDLAAADRRSVEPVPSYSEWCMRVPSLDLAEVSRFVLDGCNRGLFRTRAAANENAQEEGEQ